MRNVLQFLVAAAAIAALAVAFDARNRIGDARSVADREDDSVRAAESRLDGVLRDLEEVRREVAGAREEGRALRLQVAGIERRPVAREEPPPPSSPPTEPSRETAPDAARLREELSALQAKVFGGEATLDEQRRFWELARTTGALDEMLAEMERTVENRPADIEARMQLAQGFVAKLLTVPDGPERGMWAMKAEAQWGEVLALDEAQWEARYSRAFSWSQWPDFLNKTPDAIREFETLRRVQERGSAEPRQADTYLQLFLLHRKQGNIAKAREALEAGMQRHPASEPLRRAWEGMGW